MKSKIKFFLFFLIFFSSFSLFAAYDSFELHASSVETITGADTLGVVLRGGGDVRCYLDVTAAGTGDTLDVDLIGIVQAQRYVIGSFTQASGISVDTILFTQAPNLLSLDWTIAGDGGETFTFAVRCTSD